MTKYPDIKNKIIHGNIVCKNRKPKDPLFYLFNDNIPRHGITVNNNHTTTTNYIVNVANTTTSYTISYTMNVAHPVNYITLKLTI